jgi:uncharacterized membrane protein
MVITLFVYLLCVVCWLGGMIFFTIFTSPAVFAVLAESDAGKVVSTIFPRYYLLGYATGTISFILAIYFAARNHPRHAWVIAAIAIGIALGLTVYAGAEIRPRISSLRAAHADPNAEPERKAEFDHLHRLSVALNGGVMVLNLVALLSTAAALAPHV